MSSSDLSTLTRSSTSSQQTNRKRKRRGVPAWLLPVALLLGFLIIFALLFGKRLLPAVPVRVAPVVTIRKEIGAEQAKPSTPAVAKKVLLFQASGWIEPDPYAIEVPALVDGVVKEVFVLEGEAVKKDQLLARLIDDEAILDLREAEGGVTTLQAKIAAGKAAIPSIEASRIAQEKAVEAEEAKAGNLGDNFSRLSSLPHGSISTRRLAEAKLELKAQESMVAKARASLPAFDSQIKAAGLEVESLQSQLAESEVARERAALALSRHEIRSPVGGIVLERRVVPGQKRMLHMDNPKSGVIVELFDPGSLQARIDVPLNEAASLGVGQSVELTTELLPNLTLKGTVTRITGQADLQRNTLQVKVSIENPDSRLRPEMLVRARFYATKKSNELDTVESVSSSRYSLFVPESAFIGDNQIWVVTNGYKAELRKIQAGDERRDDHRLVKEGVRSGEKVILPPHENLRPGVRVQIQP